MKSNAIALAGCELRHHYIFDNLISRFIDEEVEFKNTIYLRFYLANHLFLRRFKDAELLELAKRDLPLPDVDKLLSFVDSTNEIIPEDLDKSSPEFLSLRYNTPAWVIRMWQKQYGKGVVFKVLKVNYRPSISSIRVNEKNVNIDEFISKHPDFSKSPVDNIIVYQGRGNAKNLEEFKKYDVFFMKMATKYVLDSLDLDSLKGIAIYSEVPNNIYLDLLTRLGEDVKADLIILAVGQYTEAGLLGFEVNKLQEATNAKGNVFVCGDIAPGGEKTVVYAVRSAKEVAYAVKKYLGGK